MSLLERGRVMEVLRTDDYVDVTSLSRAIADRAARDTPNHHHLDSSEDRVA
jgi:hypothetical protein